jgi:hypothetical protein
VIIEVFLRIPDLASALASELIKSEPKALPTPVAETVLLVVRFIGSLLLGIALPTASVHAAQPRA